MRASASLSIGEGGRVDRLAACPPVGLRLCPDAVYLVATAGGPTGADHTSLTVEVAAGQQLRVRSAAATVVYSGRGTSQSIDLRAGDGARVSWRPEPLVATTGCHHHQTARVSLGAGAGLDWSEVIVLGRHGEGPGEIEAGLAVDMAGRPLLRHHLSAGKGAPGWDGPSVLGRHKVAAFRLLAGAEAGAGPPGPLSGEGWAWSKLQEPGWLLSALVDDVADLEELPGWRGPPSQVQHWKPSAAAPAGIQPDAKRAR